MAGGSTLRLNNAAVFFLIFFYNVYDQLAKEQNLFERAGYTVPFLILTVLCLIIKSEKFISGIYILIASVMILSPDNSNMVVIAAAAIYVAAAGLVDKKWFSLSVVLLSIVLVSIRSFTDDFSVPNVVTLFAGIYFIYSIFYEIFLKKKNVDIHGCIAHLTEEENELLFLMCNGHSQESAGYELGHKDKWATNRVVRTIKNKLKKESLFEIIAIYSSNKLA